ncbi:hypothetical protein EDB81DRAFT_840104 [Dactylonectria macrodidyma]|uniref:Protein-S-isoprenylcysteine O-methyltransferase n=1 Tax=Dactylonectria macrodidyma TaxID=307937 RepID=A0A9P9FHD4_9HYPO|nr:hypothetical protein EDB81DRAFT_840104 [Dactylonectria macrodidyma]
MPTSKACPSQIAALLATILTILCFRPPNQTPQSGWKQDHLGVYASPGVALLRRLATGAIGLVHALLVLGRDNGLIYQRPEHLNPVYLFLTIAVGAPLRLMAFGQLSDNFTFRLGPPTELNTSGIYFYTQHPGYTGQIIDGLHGWGPVCHYIVVLGIIRRLLMRVKDEEDVLQKTFGEKWVVWHKFTKRFILGVA